MQYHHALNGFVLNKSMKTSYIGKNKFIYLNNFQLKAFGVNMKTHTFSAVTVSSQVRI